MPKRDQPSCCRGNMEVAERGPKGDSHVEKGTSVLQPQGKLSSANNLNELESVFTFRAFRKKPSC